MKLKRLLLSCITLTLSLGSIAEEDKTPTLVKRLVEKGIELQNTFELTEGVTGYALLDGTEGMVLYSLDGTDLIFNGDIIDKDGKNISDIMKDEYLIIPEPDYTKALADLKEGAKYFESPVKAGKQKNNIFVLHDPNCGYCKKAWSYLHTNRWNNFNINWVPVAALGQSSLENSALLIGHKDPAKLMNNLEKGYKPSRADIEKAKKYHDQVRINTSKGFKAFNAAGTPTIIIEIDGKVQVMRGFIPDRLEKILAQG